MFCFCFVSFRFLLTKFGELGVRFNTDLRENNSSYGEYLKYIEFYVAAMHPDSSFDLKRSTETNPSFALVDYIRSLLDFLGWIMLVSIHSIRIYRFRSKTSIRAIHLYYKLLRTYTSFYASNYYRIDRIRGSVYTRLFPPRSECNLDFTEIPRQIFLPFLHSVTLLTVKLITRELSDYDTASPVTIAHDR